MKVKLDQDFVNEINQEIEKENEKRRMKSRDILEGESIYDYAGRVPVVVRDNTTGEFLRLVPDKKEKGMLLMKDGRRIIRRISEENFKKMIK